MSKELEALEMIFINEFYDVTEEFELLRQALIELEELRATVKEYIKKLEAKDKLLGLYQKAIRMMVCIPQNETYHYVVKYTDDTRFNSILNQIKKLEEEMK